MLLIILKRNFCLIFKIAAKSPKTAKFHARTLSNVFLNSNCYKIKFEIFIKGHRRFLAVWRFFNAI